MGALVELVMEAMSWSLLVLPLQPASTVPRVRTASAVPTRVFLVITRVLTFC